jgi:hypothetical protein
MLGRPPSTRAYGWLTRRADPPTRLKTKLRLELVDTIPVAGSSGTAINALGGSSGRLSFDAGTTRRPSRRGALIG